jgi:hypothetical protein
MSNNLLSAEALQALEALLIEEVDEIAEQLVALLQVREIFRKILEVLTEHFLEGSQMLTANSED